MSVPLDIRFIGIYGFYGLVNDSAHIEYLDTCIFSKYDQHYELMGIYQTLSNYIVSSSPPV
jgi:hypothetical protein